jgi:two-component system cell cycle response regulator
MTILIIDDNELMRLILSKMISKNFDCQILTASNGAEALNLMAINTPDVILLDLNMPRFSGRDFLGVVRLTDSWKEIPVIIVTAQNDQETVKNIADFGVTDYIVKPFKQQEVVKRITVALSKENKTKG